MTRPLKQVTPAASEFGISLRGGDERQENFIQQKSLALLPLLCRFPLFTSNGSDRLIKLIVLVSKRLNPKELWLGLDSVVETSRVGLESLTDGIDDAPALNDEAPLDGQSNDGDAYSLELVHDTPEHLSIYLSRALLAIQIGTSDPEIASAKRLF